MPSYLIGNPPNSGFQPLISGNFWSGRGDRFPTGGIQVYWDANASGAAFIAFSGGHPNSGGPTIQSGGMFLSGLGDMDGFKLAPGTSYFIPRQVLGPSGTVNIYIGCEVAASGQGRMYWEAF